MNRDCNGNGDRRMEYYEDTEDIVSRREVVLIEDTETEEILLDCGECGHRIKLTVKKGSLVSYRSTTHYHKEVVTTEYSPMKKRVKVGGDRNDKKKKRSKRDRDGSEPRVERGCRDRDGSRDKRRKRHRSDKNRSTRARGEDECKTDPSLKERVEAARLAGHLAKLRAVKQLEGNLRSINGQSYDKEECRIRTSVEEPIVNKQKEAEQSLVEDSTGMLNEIPDSWSGREFIY